MIRADRWRHAPLALFLGGVLLAVMTRSHLDSQLPDLLADPSRSVAECWLCQRNTAWLHLALRSALEAVSALFFLGPDAGPWAVPSPWGFADTAHTRAVAVGLIALYGYQLLLALPVYWLAVRLFPGALNRAVYVAVILCALGGWPALLVNGWFVFAGLFVDWPPAYYNFAHPLLPFDWAGIGFVHLLALAILRGLTGLRPALALAVLGQVMMDNLGLVTGLALGLAAWTSGGWRKGAAALAAAGAGSVAVFAAVALVGEANWEQAGWSRAAGEQGVAAKLAAWWGYYWEIQGKYNFQWWNVTVANFISLMVWPAIAGLVLGFSFATRRGGASVPDALRALGFPALGFFVTLLIGLGKSGFGSDMGRQVMPLVTLMIPLAAMAGERLCLRYKRREI